MKKLEHECDVFEAWKSVQLSRRSRIDCDFKQGQFSALNCPNFPTIHYSHALKLVHAHCLSASDDVFLNQKPFAATSLNPERDRSTLKHFMKIYSPNIHAARPNLLRKRPCPSTFRSSGSTYRSEIIFEELIRATKDGEDRCNKNDLHPSSDRFFHLDLTFLIYALRHHSFSCGFCSSLRDIALSAWRLLPEKLLR